MKTTHRVAILGAGIMGCSTALFLARRGVEVVMYDAASTPFSGASRWNEGKIHLGFLYAGDSSFRTAKQILPGGLAFRPLVEELLGCPLECITDTDDIYLVHRDSVVSPAHTGAYFEALADHIRSHPTAKDYLVNVSYARVKTLSASELSQIADPSRVAAGFVVPERSISTRWVADQFINALEAESRIELRMSTRVLSAKAGAEDQGGPYHINTDVGIEGPFDTVVNALWEGRPQIDTTLGIAPPHQLSHRYRVSLFLKTKKPVYTPSIVLCTGPFGDIKNYNNREFYVSWYPNGLLASGENVEPPTTPQLTVANRQRITSNIFHHLSQYIPSLTDIQEQAKDILLAGGWVFAKGQGKLSDPTSTLHQRDQIGLTRTGSWFSVDTGKYSTAPWLALKVAEAICEGDWQHE